MFLEKKEQINQSLSAKIVDARVTQVFNSFKTILVTSSFGTTSAVLLHLVSRIKPECPIYFIDTGYHFKETLDYKQRLTKLLDLNVIELHPDGKKHNITEQQRMWQVDPDRCCNINKVEPLEQVKGNYLVWMSGLIGYQNNHRSRLPIIDEKDMMLKCYPLIDWNSALVQEYIISHGLPQHPLKEQGYHSVGCTHCSLPGMGREGRWAGRVKTECGLHKH